MRFSLFFTLGYNVLGLGFDVDWTQDDAALELQLGPLNVWTAKGWGWTVSFLGRKVGESRIP